MKTIVLFGSIMQNLGPFKIPLILLLMSVLIVISLLTYETIFKNDVNPERRKQGLNALLILGSMGVALGMLGQIMGIWYALAEILKAEDISLEIVFMGLQASFGTTYFGFIIFFVAFVPWLILNYIPRYKLKT